jgi:hypothetical protein
MKKGTQSPHRNVRASGKPNSKAARSEISVKRKSVKSLVIATPQNTQLAYLKNEGLIAPDEISAQLDAVPLDFTRLNSRQIGAVHSRYAVRHSHAIFQVAKRAGRLAGLKRDLRLEQAKFRYKNVKKFKTKYELDDAMQLQDEIADLLDEITVLEAEKEVIEALALGYEDLRNAASREMFRRSSEQAPRD